MEEIKRRKCELNDYDFVISLIRETIFPLVSVYVKPDENIFKERFQKDYSERTILIFNEEPIGFCQLLQKDDKLEVKGIFLSKNYRGKGIGYNLMKEFETNGIKTIGLHVWDNNPAVEFYKKLGYQIVEEKNHKYLMEKQI